MLWINIRRSIVSANTECLFCVVENTQEKNLLKDRGTLECSVTGTSKSDQMLRCIPCLWGSSCRQEGKKYMIDVWLGNSCKYCAIRHCETSLESLSMHVRRHKGLFRCYTSPLAVRKYIIDLFTDSVMKSHLTFKSSVNIIIKIKQYFEIKVPIGDVLAIWCQGFSNTTGRLNSQYVQEVDLC